MLDSLAIEPHSSEFWPRYRVRRDLRAKRIGHEFIFEQHYYRDGYLVNDANGRFVVVSVADFDALYELAGLEG